MSQPISASKLIGDSVTFEERRRYLRAGLILPGRYMLSDRREYPCETVDVSPTGVAIRGRSPRVERYGERIVAYFRDLGRVEGIIVRRAAGSFAIDIRAPENKIERLGERISWLIDRETARFADRRGVERADAWHEQTSLKTADGREYLAKLVDLSMHGAAVLVGVVLPIGERILLGDQPAYVVRRLPGGFAVTFDDAGVGGGDVPTIAARSR